MSGPVVGDPTVSTDPRKAVEVMTEILRLYVEAYANVARGQRVGQALFNALVSVRPDIAEDIRGTEDDPFHAPSGIDPRFIRAVAYIERRLAMLKLTEGGS